MTKDDIKNIIKSELDKFVGDKLDSEIEKILHNKNSLSREEVLTTIKNSMESVYKILWQKKDFWKSDIK